MGHTGLRTAGLLLFQLVLGCARTTPEAPHEAPRAASEDSGIGVRIERRDGEIVVVAVGDDSPAARAGLRAGDVVYEVDALSARASTVAEVVRAMRGPAGTSVELRLGRAPAPGVSRYVVELVVERGDASAQSPGARAPAPGEGRARSSGGAAGSPTATVVVDRDEPSPRVLVAPVRATGARSRCPGDGVVVATYRLDVRRPPFHTHVLPVGGRGQAAAVIRPHAHPAVAWCFEQESASKPAQLERGTYDLDVIAPRAARDDVGVVLVTKRGVDALFRSPLTIPTDLSVPERQLEWHYPHLRLDTTRVSQLFAAPSAEVAQRLFLDAPRELFVTVDQDLRASDFDGPAPASLPKAGDALLLWGGLDGSRSLTAYGDVLLVPRERLVVPVGPLRATAAPADAPRPAGDTGSPTAGELAKLEQRGAAARAKLTACMDDARRRLEDQEEAMQRSGQRATRTRLDAIWDEGIRRAARRCDEDGVEALERDVKQARAARDRADRLARHGQIVQRLGAL